MSVHLVKLCVGATSIEDHKNWIDQTLYLKKQQGLELVLKHTTRMVPKRKDEMINKSSLYWVIKGFLCCRQKILDIRPFIDPDGIKRCHIVLEPILILTHMQPRRAFQGWRYLDGSDAPQDLSQEELAEPMSEEMRQNLLELGLL